jgi:hypothetical protein
MSLLKETTATLTSIDSRAKEIKTINRPLLNPEKGVFLPLHIKLYLMKRVEDYESNSSESVYLEHIFPTISKVKIKEVVSEFTAVTTNVYENLKAKNYE